MNIKIFRKENIYKGLFTFGSIFSIVVLILSLVSIVYLKGEVLIGVQGGENFGSILNQDHIIRMLMSYAMFEVVFVYIITRRIKEIRLNQKLKAILGLYFSLLFFNFTFLSSFLVILNFLGKLKYNIFIGDIYQIIFILFNFIFFLLFTALKKMLKKEKDFKKELRDYKSIFVKTGLILLSLFIILLMPLIYLSQYQIRISLLVFIGSLIIILYTFIILSFDLMKLLQEEK